MDRDEVLLKHKSLLGVLSNLPKKILSVHGLTDNIAELVLCDLCNEESFDIKRAAFFVDNPDFNILKGVAGFFKTEGHKSWSPDWDNHEEITVIMKRSPFNQKVKHFTSNSPKKNNQSLNEIVSQIAKEFEIPAYSFISLGLKHGNHGLFVYENNRPEADLINHHLADILHVLGYCQIN